MDGAALYQITISRGAEKELAGIQPHLRGRIIDKIKGLSGNPRPLGVVKLRGHGAYRLRAGEYRVLYEIDDPGRSVAVFAVAHRRDVYRDL